MVSDNNSVGLALVALLKITVKNIEKNENIEQYLPWVKVLKGISMMHVLSA